MAVVAAILIGVVIVSKRKPVATPETAEEIKPAAPPTRPAQKDNPPDQIARNSPPPKTDNSPEPETADNAGVPEPGRPKGEFDTPAFLGKLRSIIRESADPQISERRSAISRNFAAFETAVQQEADRMTEPDRSLMVEKAKVTLNEWKADGGYLPPDLKQALKNAKSNYGIGGADPERNKDFLSALDKLHAKAFAAQSAIDQTFEGGMRTLADSYYVAGINKQIDRLKSESTEEPTIEDLKHEISQVKGSTAYFTGLMAEEPKNGDLPGKTSSTGKPGGVGTN